jgi:hypothetical protein
MGESRATLRTLSVDALNSSRTSYLVTRDIAATPVTALVADCIVLAPDEWPQP